MKRGDHFFHNHYFSWGTMQPLECKVTAVRNGLVFYRPYYGLHDDGTEWLGAASYIPSHKLETIVRTTAAGAAKE